MNLYVTIFSASGIFLAIQYFQYLRNRYQTSQEFRNLILFITGSVDTFVYHPFVPRTVRDVWNNKKNNRTQ